jgi:hypothetical protein
MTINQTIIFQELIKNQKKTTEQSKRFSLSDIKRVSTYLNKSIFSDECSLWTGYVTEFKNNSHYINFYFNGKKQVLHRLLYYNFIGEITDDEYLKYSCPNKGKCCTLKHIHKVVTNDNITSTVDMKDVVHTVDAIETADTVESVDSVDSTFDEKRKKKIIVKL